MRDGWHDGVKYSAIYFPVSGGLNIGSLVVIPASIKHLKEHQSVFSKTDEGLTAMP
jgi:hypothetical protein